MQVNKNAIPPAEQKEKRAFGSPELKIGITSSRDGKVTRLRTTSSIYCNYGIDRL